MYSETDLPNFVGSTYSASAVAREQAVRQFDRSWVFRLRMPFDGTPHPRNLFNKLAGYEKAVDDMLGKELTINVNRSDVSRIVIVIDG